MRVLHVASECAPLVKTGGLADVIGALPAALAAEGVEARVMLPAYPAVLDAIAGGEVVAEIAHLPGGPASLRRGEAAGLAILALDAPRLYAREGGPYQAGGRDWPDNHLRFGALCRAAAGVAREGAGGWRPDVLHAHDWQAGLAPAFLRYDGEPAPPSVITIHNIAFQGNFPLSTIGELGLPPEWNHPGGYEFWGQVGFLKAGLVHASRITTVSPGYAREIVTPEFGLGLEGVLAHRRDALSGILNGVDLAVWSPEADPHLPAPFSVRALAGKKAARRALAARFGLDAEGAGPLLVVVSRFSTQKGLDLLIEAAPRFLDAGGRIAVLGSGDAGIERALATLAGARAGSFGLATGYDEPLAHLMIAGGDAIAVPSRFEPCGLTQLYGLRYGTLPVVARTGGLGDTVIDANPAALSAGVATGFQFAPGSAEALAGALDRLLGLWRDQTAWRRTMRRAMAQPVGWEVSARAYAALYREIAPGAA